MAKAKQPISSERLDDFFKAAARNVGTYRDRMLHWLASADHVTSRVASGTSSYEEQAMFVVRLAGILSDLRGRFRGPLLTADELRRVDAHAQLRERHRAKVVDSIATLYASLTEDELLWLELRRHEQCHPILDGYMPKASDHVNWDRRVSAILDDKVLPLAEIVERCAKLEKTHGGFVGVATSIARRVFEHVGAVQLAMVPLMSGIGSDLRHRSGERARAD